MLTAARQMGYGGIQGVQVSAPFGRYAIAAEVIADVLPKPVSAPVKGHDFSRAEDNHQSEGLQPLRESALGNV